MAKISNRQQEILDFITDSMDEQGYPPTLREICAKFEIASTNGARYHLRRLHELGYIHLEDNKSRGMRPVEYKRPPEALLNTYQLPILGRVPAGPFSLASEDIREDELTVDPTFFGSRTAEPELFGLRVTGDSMINEGIHDGDIVVVKSQPQANDGDIVVARLEDEATVKRFRKGRNEVVLEPANEAYQPIRISDLGGNDHGQDFALLGIVVGLIRSM